MPIHLGGKIFLVESTNDRCTIREAPSYPAGGMFFSLSLLVFVLLISRREVVPISNAVTSLLVVVVFLAAALFCCVNTTIEVDRKRGTLQVTQRLLSRERNRVYLIDDIAAVRFVEHPYDHKGRLQLRGVTGKRVNLTNVHSRYELSDIYTKLNGLIKSRRRKR